jgi:threonyl-tRNA synthetase
VEQGLLVLTSVEAGDESGLDRVTDGATAEIARLVDQLKVDEVMVLPFAHLFAEPADPQIALSIIDGVVGQLREKGLRVERPPFGWFHTWDLKAKGHPLSRVARTVRP